MTRVVVVGCGRWGPNYVRNFTELPQSEVVACCDSDPSARQQIGRMYPRLRVLADVEQAIGDVEFDAGIVSTPARTHRPLVEQLLEADKHVLVEKPLASTVKDARSIAERVEASDRILMVGHIFRYNAGVNKVRELLYDGTVESVRYIECVRTNMGPVRDDVSVIWDLATHDASIVLHLLNDMPAQVAATSASFLRDGRSDAANISLVFSDGRVAYLWASWIDARKRRLLRVIGSNCVLEFDDMNVQEPLRVVRARLAEEPSITTFGEFHVAPRTGDITIPAISLGEPLKAQCEAFLKAVQTGQQPMADVRDGVRVCEIAEAAERSAADGGAPVPVAPHTA